MPTTYTPQDVAQMMVTEGQKQHLSLNEVLVDLRTNCTYDTDLDAAEVEIRRLMGEVQQYRPAWSFDDCGCIPPSKIRVLADGKAIAVYSECAPVPYRNLRALVEAFNQGGDLDEQGLYDALGEPAPSQYWPGELFGSLRLGVKEYGVDAIADGYRSDVESRA